jgi:hypothetical protein
MSFRYNRNSIRKVSFKGGIVIGKWWIICILFLVVAVMTSGCLGSRTPPVSRPPVPAVLVDYYRTGGIAGIQDRLVIFDNGVAVVSSRTESHEIELNQTDINRITQLFEQGGFSALEGNYSGRRGSADLIKYTIIYQNKTISAEDTAIPPSMQPIIDELNRIIRMSTTLDAQPSLTIIY